MNRVIKRIFRCPLCSALIVLAVLLSGIPEAQARRGEKSLKLRVNPAIGKPGGTVAVVLRTYAARPIRQGQISLRVRRRPAPGKAGLTLAELTQPVRPIATLVSATVYSTRRDSVSQASLSGTPENQSVKVKFNSRSATVNASDGPLAVFFLRLDPSVAPGQEYLLEVDPGVTSLTDEAGRPITLEPINAELTVRAASAPLSVEAEGDEVEPGEAAELGVQTFEPFPVSGGRVTLRFNPAVAAGPASVVMDPRYGNATFQVDRSQPGVLVVNFQSRDMTLNTVPGGFVSIRLPTKASVAIGTSSPVTLDPAGTHLLSVKGRKLKLKLENGELAFE